jgi:DNA-binding beta-propeller fold protein YncE
MRQRRAKKVAGLVAVVALAGLAGGLGGCAGGGSTSRPGSVAGRYIVSISDADMTAEAFQTGLLGEREPEGKDLLTVVKLPIEEPRTAFAQVEVSNSALGPPQGLAVSEDGRYAFVVEMRGRAPAGATSVSQLPVGDTVYCVDLSDPLKPAVTSSTFVGREPTTVAVHPRGDLVAVATTNAKQQIVVIPFADGKLAESPLAWPLLGLDDDAAKPSCVAWSPTGDVLAVTLPQRNEVMFYRFKRSDGEGGARLEIAPMGAPVAAGPYPYSGRFTADGRFFVTTNVNWSTGAFGPSGSAAIGSVSVVRVDMGDASAHELTDRVNVGISPMGLALSRDSRLVVAANMQHSGAGGPGGSLSLLRLDGEGKLTPVAEYPINAVPAGISFDAADRFVVVTQFRSFDPGAVDGELGFHAVRGGSSPSLVPAEFWVGVGKGPHGVIIVR